MLCLRRNRDIQNRNDYTVIVGFHVVSNMIFLKVKIV